MDEALGEREFLRLPGGASLPARRERRPRQDGDQLRMDYVRSYIDNLKALLDQLPEEHIRQVVDVLQDARLEGRQIFIMGNGGSAATASHFVADLAKNTRREGWPDFRVLGLADNMAILTAYANDEGYENVFARQLDSFVRAGDLVIAISASGNSPNVIRAVELAARRGATTLGFTGFTGGKLAALVDLHLHVPSDIIEQVEDVHLMLEHLVVKALREMAWAEDSPATRPQAAASSGDGDRAGGIRSMNASASVS